MWRACDWTKFSHLHRHEQHSFAKVSSDFGEVTSRTSFFCYVHCTCWACKSEFSLDIFGIVSISYDRFFFGSVWLLMDKEPDVELGCPPKTVLTVHLSKRGSGIPQRTQVTSSSEVVLSCY